MGMGGIWKLLNWKIWEWDLSFRWEWQWNGNGNKVIEMGGILYRNLFPNTSTAKGPLLHVAKRHPIKTKRV